MSENGYIDRCIGNYRIVALLGSGGFGSVYRGVHTILTDRTVAIKILHTYLASMEECSRFLQEARLLEYMHHPHILHIFDVGIDNRVPYLVAEFASNGSLRDRIKRYAPNLFPLETSLSILSQIGQALEYAHQQNVIHRDLKPENILFDAKGAALLADFGIATQLTTNSVKHVTVTGTPSYMAPEHFQGSASKESDQYALACIAYELFTGQVPFTSSDFFALGFKHLTENAIAPTQLNPALPVTIEVAILKAMSKQRGDRYVDIRSFVTAMQDYDVSYDSTVISASQTQLSSMQSTYIPTPSLSRMPEAHNVVQASSTDLSRYDKPQMDRQSAQETSLSSGQGSVTPPPTTPPLQDTGRDECSYMFTHPTTLTTHSYEGNESRPIQEPLTPLPTQEAQVTHAYEVSPRREKGQLFPTDGGIWSGGIIYSERKHDSGSKRMIAAITGAVVAMVIVGSLIFAFLPSVHSPNPSTQTASMSLTTTATKATTSKSTTAPTPQPTPTIVLNGNSNAQKTSGSTPIPTLTATPVSTHTPGPTAGPVISETFQVYFTNSNATGVGVSTQHSYSGKVSITISGYGQSYSTRYSDAFYIYTDTSGNPLATPYTDLRWVLYINGNTAKTSVGLPAYNSSHIYTVSMNVSQPGTINFGIRDSENSDNTGYYTITVQQL
ncbi:MAG TPA: serine/threonine-protein kinase [Ktedonobacteraceae bacterium]